MIRLSADEARRYLVGHLGLRRRRPERGAAGVRAMLARLRCVQLDPLAPMGDNADLVTLARVSGVEIGDVYRHLLPGHAFEHFAKERCLLPASAFPRYREQAAATPWWRLGERLRRLPDDTLDAVLEEVRARGPIGAAELSDRGRVAPLDWSGWRGTSRASKMALEVLWTRCQVVVCGRGPGGKIYDVPERALPDHGTVAAEGFARWALLERVEAAGLLARAGGPTWSMLSEARTSGLVEALLAEGALREVRVEGSSRPYLAPAGFADERAPRDDGRMRILGPLDPVLWDRRLVRQAFGFDYVWEVYKPKARRRFGWYVCPLMHRGRLVGRLEGRVAGRTLVVERLFREAAPLDERALDAALEAHATACGAESFRRPRRARATP